MNKSLQLTTIEEEMFNEVFEVFSKYKGKTREFGIQLIHSHFSMEADETLYETHDKENRVLLLKPVKKNEIEDFLATAWQEKNKRIEVLTFCCDATISK